MVFPDLSAFEVKPVKSHSPLPLAAVADRLLALVLDFLLFSPVVSLLVADLIRQAKTYFMLDSSSPEGMVAVLLVFLISAFLVTFFQALFLYFWQATPGQFFLQLRVVSYPQSQEKLGFNQCVVRAAMWSCGFLLLALPYLEILSHPARRAFHERASDTLVVTLKRNFDEGPYPLESRFISSWLRFSFLFFLLFGVLGFLRTYHGLVSGKFKSRDASNSLLCSEMKDVEFTGMQRLDVAITLFLLNEISAECLEKESEASLWGDPVNSQELAYLAKFYLSEGAMQKDYLTKVCEISTSSACLIAEYSSEGGEAKNLANADHSWLLTRFLMSEEKFANKDYGESLKILTELQKEFGLKRGLERRYIRSIWALSESGDFSVKKDRSPASSDSATKDWIDDFKEKYEVP